MTKNAHKNLMSYLRQVVSNWRDDPSEDADLLKSVVEVQEETAFQVLAGRYGLSWMTLAMQKMEMARNIGECSQQNG